jgi:hypothetical protein
MPKNILQVLHRAVIFIILVVRVGVMFCLGSARFVLEVAV